MLYVPDNPRVNTVYVDWPAATHRSLAPLTSGFDETPSASADFDHIISLHLEPPFSVPFRSQKQKNQRERQAHHQHSKSPVSAIRSSWTPLWGYSVRPYKGRIMSHSRNAARSFTHLRLLAFSAIALAACSSRDASHATGWTVGTAAFTPLTRTAHPLALPENDLGRLDPTTTLHHLSLVFKLSPAQKAERDALLVGARASRLAELPPAGSRPKSTPRASAPARETSAGATTWLASQGFAVHETVAPRRARDLHRAPWPRSSRPSAPRCTATTPRRRAHYAMARPPSVPAELADRVLAVTNTHDFYRATRQAAAAHRRARTRPAPAAIRTATATASRRPTGPSSTTSARSTPRASAARRSTARASPSPSSASPTSRRPTSTAFRTRYGLAANNGHQDAGAQHRRGAARTTAPASRPCSTSSGPARSRRTPPSTTSTPARTTPTSTTPTYYAIEKNLGAVLSESWGGCEAGADARRRRRARRSTARRRTCSASPTSRPRATRAPPTAGGKGGLYVNLPASYPGVTSVGGTGFAMPGGLTFTGGTVTGARHRGGLERVQQRIHDERRGGRRRRHQRGLRAPVLPERDRHLHARRHACRRASTRTPSGRCPTSPSRPRRATRSTASSSSARSIRRSATAAPPAPARRSSRSAAPRRRRRPSPASWRSPIRRRAAASATSTRCSMRSTSRRRPRSTTSRPATTRSPAGRPIRAVPATTCSTASPATAGYDCATGLGSVDASNLVNALGHAHPDGDDAWARRRPRRPRVAASRSPRPSTSSGTNTHALGGTVTFTFRSYLGQRRRRSVLDARRGRDHQRHDDVRHRDADDRHPARAWCSPAQVRRRLRDVRRRRAPPPVVLGSADDHLLVPGLPCASIRRPPASPRRHDQLHGDRAAWRRCAGTSTGTRRAPPASRAARRINETTGAFKAGTGANGYVIVVALDADGAETFSEVTVAGGGRHGALGRPPVRRTTRASS